MKFVIIGNPITKKNSQRLIVRNGRPYIIPSKQYKDYEKEALFQLIQYGVKDYSQFYYPINVPVNVCCRYYMQTRRKVDLANLLEGSLDILIEAGILDDDNCSIAASYDGSMVFYDKQDPRVEIEITPIIGYEGLQ